MTGNSDPTAKAEREDEDTPDQPVAFPIVGIGSSAGGVEALCELFSELPNDTGMAFVLIQHLDPKHESKLGEVLSKRTAMPIDEASHGLSVEPDHVYVIAPNTTLAISEGAFQVEPRSTAQAPHHPVDAFFRSLAEERQSRAIGIILSGMGSDGTLGLEDIKAGAGITFSQEPASAKFTGMPISAAASGAVDFVLQPAEIARELKRLGHHPYLASDDMARRMAITQDGMARIARLVRQSFNVDLTQYRDSTMQRRVARRMVLRKVGSISDYAQLAESQPAELHALYDDLFIHVTSFFRDPELFESMKATVFPELIKDPARESIRIWTAGCSTGEEAYSVAMSLLEFLDGKAATPSIQIFATDIGERFQLSRARAGFYPLSIEGQVSPERLHRFFKKEEGGYRIHKSVRDTCVFARQNLVADPPFSNIDLITCRNVLIYLAPTAQKHVVPMLHYALNSRGFLVLGASETVGSFNHLFSLVDRKHRIYAKNPAATRSLPHFPAPSGQPLATPLRAVASDTRDSTASEWHREADRIVLGSYAPAGVLVNEALQILQFRGKVGAFFEPHPGEATLNLLKMVRESLALKLKEALDEAKRTDTTVRAAPAQILDADQVREVVIEVTPIRLRESNPRCFLVVFDERKPSGDQVSRRSTKSPGALSRLFGLAGKAESADATPEDPIVGGLRQELAAAQQALHSIVDEREAGYEELKSAHEEILSSNEELQSTNEELQTSKEELQSMNEELTTVNEQMFLRNQELTHANNDLQNLLSSSNIPLVMVACNLSVRRFNEAAGRLLNLLPSDVGRPLSHIKPSFDLPEFDGLIRSVIETEETAEREIRDLAGQWHLLRVYPYRTTEQKIEGAVVVLIDIDAMKRSEDELRHARDYAEAIVNTVRNPVLILDEKLGLRTANRAFYETLRLDPGECDGAPFNTIGNRLWDDADLIDRLRATLATNEPLVDFEIERVLPESGARALRLNARLMHDQGIAKHPLLLVSIEDITDLKQREHAAIEADRRKDEFLAMLAHELRNPLAAIDGALKVARSETTKPSDLEWTRSVIERQATHMLRLIDDLLDVSRMTTDKIQLRRERHDLAALARGAVEDTRRSFERRKHNLHVTLEPETMPIHADATRVEQILVNLLTNAARYTDPGGDIWLRVTAENGAFMIRVQDTGIGIDAEMQRNLFQPFIQADHSLARSQGGLGVGLALVKKLVELHGGDVAVASEGLGKGSTFTVRLPAALDASLEATEPPVKTRKRSSKRSARILLVDDNEDTVLATSLLLQLRGHKVRTATEGVQALELALKERLDVVILDIGLPGMNGYEIAASLRAQPGFGRTLLIAISGYGRIEDRARAQEAGFDHHLTKPVDHDALFALIEGSAEAEPSAAQGQSSERKPAK